jgi:mono/diheme cytochrome c family protein/glucose/arabinose dehydrogenase
MKAPVSPWFTVGCLFAAASAFALNKGNAGPEEVTIKFKLPPPPVLTPEEELKTFKLEKGFRIELVACEPMIQSPTAISFDDQGRMFVVEMRGYMNDVEGGGEKETNGRISLLEDTKGVGRMDKATVFVDGLVLPRSVLAVNGGALVAEPPNLYFCKDTKGVGVADVRTVVATDYGTRGGQPEHTANTPVWALDNRIWSAGYGTSFRLVAGTWQRGAGLGRGQYGLCQDDAGRLYYNYNSDLLRTDLLPASAFARNPLLRNVTSVNSQVIGDQSVFPIHPTPGVNRGYDASTLRADGTLAKTTATCGAVVYRGDLFGAEYHGNAFIPEPAANLVKRLVLTEKDGVVKGVAAIAGQEFLASTDERFRPVQIVNGPDGAIYVVDLYRGIIQHQSFLTHYLVANIKDRKLEQPVNRGRIWRIVPEKATKVAAVKVPAATAARVELLRHPSGWVRDAAQRLLVESADASAVPALRQLLKTEGAANAFARLHALWTLEGLNALDASALRLALKDADPQVRAAGVRLATPDLLPELLTLTGEKEVLVQAHLAIRLAAVGSPDADQALAKLLAAHGQNTLVREGALTGMRGKETAIAKLVAAQASAGNVEGPAFVVEALATLVSQSGKAGPMEDMLNLAVALDHKAMQLAVIRGLDRGGRDPKAKSTKAAAAAKVTKLLWLPAEPPAMAKLAAALTDKAGAAALAGVNERVMWVGKPGAPKPPVVTPLNPAQTAAYERGKTIFNGLCAACHQPHGYGLDGLAPPLVDSEWVTGKPDVLARIVMNGLGGPVKVAGRTWDLTMPPMAQLNDEDLAAVLTYVRREWEHTASPVDAKFVKGIRDQYATHPSWTADELKPAAPAKK